MGAGEDGALLLQGPGHDAHMGANGEAMQIVNAVGQLIAFKRDRADRKIKASDESDPYKRQSMQLTRDIENVNLITEACDKSLEMFDEALGRLRDQEKNAA